MTNIVSKIVPNPERGIYSTSCLGMLDSEAYIESGSKVLDQTWFLGYYIPNPSKNSSEASGGLSYWSQSISLKYFEPGISSEGFVYQPNIGWMFLYISHLWNYNDITDNTNLLDFYKTKDIWVYLNFSNANFAGWYFVNRYNCVKNRVDGDGESVDYFDDVPDGCVSGEGIVLFGDDDDYNPTAYYLTVSENNIYIKRETDTGWTEVNKIDSITDINNNIVDVPKMNVDYISDGSVNVTVSNGVYIFDGKLSNDYFFAVNKGAYLFNDVPQAYPIAFFGDNRTFTYSSPNDPIVVNEGGVDINYLYGDVSLEVLDEFFVISYKTTNSYMGGQNNLIFSDKNAPRSNLRINVVYNDDVEGLEQSHKDIIDQACRSIEQIILNNIDYTLTVEKYRYESSTSETLAYAAPTGPIISLGIDNNLAVGGNGVMGIDPADVDSPYLYKTVLHELLHAFSVGSLWAYDLFDNGTYYNDFIEISEEYGAQYNGVNAVREYNNLLNVNVSHVPLQTYWTKNQPTQEKFIQKEYSFIIDQNTLDDGFILFFDPWYYTYDPEKHNVTSDIEGKNISEYQVGDEFKYNMYLTFGGHWDEGQRIFFIFSGFSRPKEVSSRTSPDGQIQPLMANELMTPLADVDAPLTRISIGFLHDLGWEVDYTKTIE